MRKFGRRTFVGGVLATSAAALLAPRSVKAAEWIAIRGASITSGQSRTITSTDIHARNSFTNPHTLEPKNAPASAKGSSFVFQFAPASVTQLVFILS